MAYPRTTDFRHVLSLVGFWLCATSLMAEDDRPRPEEPSVAPASSEGEDAIGGFTLPEGFTMSLFAAEPLVANPVAFCFDDKGRLFVAETFRQGQGVEDNRNHNYWLEDDIAAETVEDRRAYILKHHPEAEKSYTQHDDRIRLIEDRDGDGQADHAQVFSDRFNDIVDGTGAGVLYHKGDLFYTNIPHLWRLRDTTGDGVADQRDSLHQGYGVKFAFRGHDLHGPVMGPDGKLYYSIGDRGYNVTNEGTTHKDVYSGAVFRCNPDGTDLEVVYTGLRNPQELAFDDYGNLFTCDNNSDSGDQCRWTLLVHGGTSGWRMTYQYLSDRGPFNREKLWHEYHPGQAAYINPPIKNISDGPSGLVHYPGTGLGEAYKGTFFLCDFRGGPANSGVRSFRMSPKGATFELVDSEQFLWQMLATDIDFGADGAMYIADWVDGWTGLNKGRIYRLQSDEHGESELVKEVQTLLAADFTEKQPADLATLLSHADRRVRMKAQFELAERKELSALEKVAQDSAADQLARLHAIWGIGQIAASEPAHRERINTTTLLHNQLVKDQDPEVRANAAKVLGDHKVIYGLPDLLEDENARVRYHALIALGKCGPHGDTNQLIAKVVDILVANADQDPVLRHGAIMALAGTRNLQALADLAEHASASVRIGAVVALRRLESPSLVRYLNDGDELVVLEAARAIYDLPIAAALPQLAAKIEGGWKEDALLRRVLNANFQLGDKDNAEALARFAARADMPLERRMEAMEMLASWNQPGNLDLLLNSYRPKPEREASVAKDALALALPKLLTAADEIRNRSASLAAELGIEEIAPVLVGLVEDKDQSGQTRADALTALVRVQQDAQEMVTAAIASDAPLLRATARHILAEKTPEQAAAELAKGVAAENLVERQKAFGTIAKFKPPGSEALVRESMAQLQAGSLPQDTWLDALTAAEAFSEHEEIAPLLTGYRESLDADDPLAEYLPSLEGGNAPAGRRVFFEKTEVSCVRCHRAMGTGGRVGPELDKIGQDKDRKFLLQSIVLPNAEISKGFESILVLTLDGQTLSGVVKEETDEAISLVTAEGQLITIPQDDIDDRRSAKSPMPEDIYKQLNRHELRDLVQFLSELKGEHAVLGHE
ncbi:MAG: PVC-type heme-binding CxxCH protein [Pirellulaceae bacterium]